MTQLILGYLLCLCGAATAIAFFRHMRRWGKTVEPENPIEQIIFALGLALGLLLSGTNLVYDYFYGGGLWL